MKRWSRWPTWGCAATCRSRTVAGDAGEASSPPATPCMPTGGGSGGPADGGCCASAASGSNDPTPISTGPGGAGCICGGTPTSASASWCTPAARTWVCSCDASRHAVQPPGRALFDALRLILSRLWHLVSPAENPRRASSASVARGPWLTVAATARRAEGPELPTVRLCDLAHGRNAPRPGWASTSVVRLCIADRCRRFADALRSHPIGQPASHAGVLRREPADPEARMVAALGRPKRRRGHGTLFLHARILLERNRRFSGSLPTDRRRPRCTRTIASPRRPCFSSRPSAATRRFGLFWQWRWLAVLLAQHVKYCK